MNETIHKVVSEFLSQRLHKQGKTAPLTLDTPVFEADLLNSLALVDLIAEVEKHMGRDADMLMFDPSDINTVRELITQLSATFND